MGRWIEGLGPAPCQQIPIGELVLVHYLNIARPETDSELEAWRTLLKAHCGAGMALAVKPETPVFGIHILRRQTAGEPRDIVPRTKTNELQSPEADARTARLDLRAKRPVVGFSVIGMSSAGEALTADRAVPFIRCGASALVGPWWPTAERCDEVFWSSFYNLLWRRVPLGEAVWRARLAVRNAWPNRADWLSYTLVGDPQARPYEPEPGEGYASLEALDATGVMNPGRPYKFRVSLRSRPPVWYADKLVRTGTPPAGLTAMFLGPHLEIAPQGPVAMCQAGRSMTEAVVNVTAHNEGIFPLIVQLLEGDEHVRTLQLTLRFDH
jgi:hypothetical protein